MEGRELDAERLYEQAIRSARANGFVHNEALANELAARFYAARGFEKIARMYLQDARYGYLRWGADGKVRQLERSHPWLREASAPLLPTATVGAAPERLELAAVLRAAQAVSGEILLDRLIETLMTLALEHAGAERGLLILLRGDTPQLAAVARTNHKTVEVVRGQEAVAPDEMPETVLRTVLRTRESVILDDAAAPNPFAMDAYLREKRVRSVLCLPLLKQAELIGLLYLENNLASHVFTPTRISVLELLASQAAISLENARLYADLRLGEERWRNLFESVPVGITVTGSHGRYVAANPAFQRMTGYSETELHNLSPIDITHEDDRAATAVVVAKRVAGIPHTQRAEKRYRRKDGGVVWVDASAFVAPVVVGPPVFGAVLVDITDRKRAEESLRKAQADLAHAARVTTLGELAASLAHEISQPLAGVATSGNACLRWLNRIRLISTQPGRR